MKQEDLKDGKFQTRVNLYYILKKHAQNYKQNPKNICTEWFVHNGAAKFQRDPAVAQNCLFLESYLKILDTYLHNDIFRQIKVEKKRISNKNDGILFSKLFWPTVRINLKFDAEGLEFVKFLRSLEQFRY